MSKLKPTTQGEPKGVLVLTSTGTSNPVTSCSTEREEENKGETERKAQGTVLSEAAHQQLRRGRQQRASAPCF